MSSLQLNRFLVFAFISLCWIVDAFGLRSDWRDFIDKDLYKKYVGKIGHQFNRSFFQGDIDKVDRDVSDQKVVMAFNAVKDAKFRWPDATVPFTISATFSDEEQMLIRNAITAITELTNDCVRFVDRITEVDYIEIIRGLSCYSSGIGRQGGAQHVSFTIGCLEEYGDVQHELLHVLGFYHEHTREDRDQYVTINWRNIREDDKVQFQKFDGLTFGLPYDYLSVMHYPWNSFAMNPNLPTMIPNLKGVMIGQKANLSPTDIQRIRKAYGCDELDNTTHTSDIETTTTPITSIEQTTTVITTPMPTTYTFNHNQTADGNRFTTNKKSYLSLPDWKQINMSYSDCQLLNTNNCKLDQDSCIHSFFSCYCTSYSTSNDIRNYLEKIKRALPSSPISFNLEADITEGHFKFELKPELFEDVSDNIISLEVTFASSFSCDALETLPLPNLFQLGFRFGHDVTINKDNLKRFRKLRVLYFYASTIRFLEEGVFESLINLKTVAFDYGINLLLGRDQTIFEDLYLRRLHCSGEYSWLRDYLTQHPQLLQPRDGVEICPLSTSRCPVMSFTSRDIYYPADCSKE